MEKDIELIENYLAGNLSEDDKIKVEARLAAEPVFADRFEIVKGSYVALDPEVQALENDLQSIYQDFQKAPAPRAWRMGYAIAASVLVLTLAFLGYFLWVQNPSPEALYISYLEIPANNIATRGAATDDALKLGMEAYDQQDYQLALDRLQEVLQSQPSHEGAIFYSGICQLLLGQDQNALVSLKSFEQMTSSEYYSPAQWYLGLTYLKIDDTQSAGKVLTKLQQSGKGKYAVQAAELLKEL